MHTCMFGQVPLGVLMKSEQRGEDMVDIVQHIHQYIPKLVSGQYYPIFLLEISLHEREPVQHRMLSYNQTKKGTNSRECFQKLQTGMH